jgi:hypothetical protein
MKRRRSPWPWLTPLTLLGGCLLPSYENVASSVVPEAGSDAGGSANVVAGAPGEATGGAGAPAGGDGPRGEAPKAVADTFVVQQGKAFKVKAANGVLSNDSPGGLEVISQDDTDKKRPKAYDADVAIAADGSLSFEPAAAFFGRYYVDYTVEDSAGQTATATVTFIVQPVDAGLDATVDGIGGVMLTGGGQDAVGTALAPLGDVNGDGFDDFAVGASGASAGNGSIYVVFGRADFAALTLGALAGSSTEARFAVLAGSAEAPISKFVASAGRFNSDELNDILVGSPDSDTGRLFVVYGDRDLKPSLTLSKMSDAQGLTLSGLTSNNLLGLNVSGGGDFNGDHKTDLVGGIHPDGSTQGGLCLLLENPVTSQSLDKLSYAVIKDAGVYDLPNSLAFAGDVTGDGKDDLLASSNRHVALLFGQGSKAEIPADILGVDNNRGLLRLRENGVTDTAPVAAAGDVNGDDVADFTFCDQFGGDAQCYVFFGPLSLADSLDKPDWKLAGFATSPALPRLASGTDINQDGFADQVVAEAGAAYVVFGRDAGFGTVDVSSLGSDGFSLAAVGAGTLASVATIGDVNGDGYGDFAVGEPTAGGGVGQVYVVFGGPFSADQR